MQKNDQVGEMVFEVIPGNAAFEKLFDQLCKIYEQSLVKLQNYQKGRKLGFYSSLLKNHDLSRVEEIAINRAVKAYYNNSEEMFFPVSAKPRLDKEARTVEIVVCEIPVKFSISEEQFKTIDDDDLTLAGQMRLYRNVGIFYSYRQLL